MVDPGENRTVTLIREFGEEALNTLEATDDQKEEINQAMDAFFKAGNTVSEACTSYKYKIDLLSTSKEYIMYKWKLQGFVTISISFINFWGMHYKN